ncbi:MAG: hypothetical protein A4E32_01201 [Methanomassiliicoccales archaeon PtaU1.Bin124]|nr:MAG: hypothetical protein A4E32_01201 [Methanomassiliicoccales archaeon PtaU1.Bin124]
MMMKDPNQENLIKKYLALDIAPLEDQFDKNVDVDFIGRDMRTNGIIFVEFSRNADFPKIAKLNLLKSLMLEDNERVPSRYVIITRAASNNIFQLAKKLGIEIILTERGEELRDQSKNVRMKPLKVTPEKTWKVICTLISNGPSSIRQLSLKSDVSYGWAHATITQLLDHDIVIKNGDYVHIIDQEKLLNAVAWERPVKKLKILEMSIPFRYDQKAAALESVQDHLRSHGVEFAFGLFDAGSRYTNYAFRNDSIQIYLREDDLELIDDLSTAQEGTIVLQAYRPDREIFDSTRILEGIRVTSPCQTLMDLAGLGYGGKDMTMELVKKIASLR